MEAKLRTSIDATVKEAITALTTSSTKKVVLDAAEGATVTAYWCGPVLRIDIKGVQGK